MNKQAIRALREKWPEVIRKGGRPDDAHDGPRCTPAQTSGARAPPRVSRPPMKWYAVAHPGLEPVVARELSTLGVSGAQHPGGVRFDAALSEGVDLLGRLRTPSRVLLELITGPCRSPDELTALVKRVPWKTYLLPDAKVEIQVTSKASRVHFTDSAERKVHWLVQEALKGPRVVERTPRAAVPQRLSVRIDADHATISLDPGGELLHFRGWRTEQGPAALRENLAAAMLYAAGWQGDEPLVDPFCGSGTICIEAALMAAGRSPYGKRAWAWHEWPALAKHRPRPPAPARVAVPILGSDRDGRVIAAATANAERAGVEVSWSRVDVADLGPPGPTGLVVCNPPYGKRLGEGSEGRAYQALGETLRGRFEGWRALFLAPDPGLAARAHRDARRLTTFSNGGLKVGMYAVEIR